MDDLLTFPLTVYPTSPLLPRVWGTASERDCVRRLLRRLAEAAGYRLVTADRRLAGAQSLDAPSTWCDHATGGG